MSVKIKIPESLQSKTGGESSIEVADSTLGGCLHSLIRRHPDLTGEIVDDRGTLLLRWMILINGKISKKSEDMLHPVRGGDVIALIPMIAGG
ncbi:MAG: MoaD/ThiS family protein [Deltaproteobacteria bacterium]